MKTEVYDTISSRQAQRGNDVHTRTPAPHRPLVNETNTSRIIKAASLDAVGWGVLNEQRRFRFSLTARQLLLTVVEEAIRRGRFSVSFGTRTDLAIIVGTQREELNSAIHELVETKVLSLLEDGSRRIRFRLQIDHAFWTAREDFKSPEVEQARRGISFDDDEDQLKLEPILSATQSDPLGESLSQISVSTALASEHQSSEIPTVGWAAVRQGIDCPSTHLAQSPAKMPKVSGNPTRHASCALSFKTPTESAFSLEVLKVKASSGNESEAMEGFKQVLGHAVWEGEDREYADGAKWRLRWRENREKVRRVFLDLIDDLAQGKIVRAPGGRAESLWKEFA